MADPPDVVVAALWNLPRWLNTEPAAAPWALSCGNLVPAAALPLRLAAGVSCGNRWPVLFGHWRPI